MAKEVKAKLKLQCPAGEATPAPPVGPALGQHGVNIGMFVKRFNDGTAAQKGQGLIIPVEITVYTDKSFDLVFKSPPASVLLRKEAGAEKGSGEPNRNKVGKVTQAQLKKIAEMKMNDLNTKDVKMAMRVIAGTARSMGIDVEG